MSLLLSVRKTWRSSSDGHRQASRRGCHARRPDSCAILPEQAKGLPPARLRASRAGLGWHNPAPVAWGPGWIRNSRRTGKSVIEFVSQADERIDMAIAVAAGEFARAATAIAAADVRDVDAHACS